MSLVNFVKLSANQYSSLRDKDENTFYLVNDSGDFSYDTFEDNAKLYLGEKQIIPNKATTTSDGLMSKEDKAKLDNLEQAVEGDSTISPFAGFMTEDEMNQIVLENTDSNDGAVYCDFYGMGFYYKVGNMFHAFWNYGYEYNSGISSDGYNKAKEGKIFSYNDKHYIIIGGVLQDMSVLLSKTQITSLVSDTATNTLSSSKLYTDAQIAAKIQLVQQLPDTPVDGVLYCIPETPLSKPTEE